MTPRSYIEKALDIQAENRNDPAAISQYERAIEASDPEKDRFELLYAHYEIMRIYAQSDLEKAALYGERCLAILNPVIDAGAIMHFSEEGQFYEEVVRYASNSIAWLRGFTKAAAIRGMG